MPIYEFKCRDCDKQIEKIMRQADATIPCPECGGTAQRSVSVFAAAGQDSGGGCMAPPGGGFG